jgi:hypothetical protein
MLSEHKAIVQTLDELGRAAKAERHPEVSRFVEELTAHAETEEQVLYPAAILVGEYLKLKLPAANRLAASSFTAASIAPLGSGLRLRARARPACPRSAVIAHSVEPSVARRIATRTEPISGARAANCENTRYSAYTRSWFPALEGKVRMAIRMVFVER